ncbi:hypothetical protein D3C76_1142740 [compost metagenome]
MRVAALKVTERASLAGRRSRRAQMKPSTGASSMKPMYTGTTGSKRSKSRSTTAICEAITTISTKAIAGTGNHAQASFQVATARERRAPALVSTARAIGNTINSTKASTNGVMEIATWLLPPSIRARYTGSSTSCASNNRGVAARVRRESPLPMWVNTTT